MRTRMLALLLVRLIIGTDYNTAGYQDGNISARVDQGAPTLYY